MKVLKEEANQINLKLDKFTVVSSFTVFGNVNEDTIEFEIISALENDMSFQKIEVKEDIGTAGGDVPYHTFELVGSGLVRANVVESESINKEDEVKKIFVSALKTVGNGEVEIEYLKLRVS